MKQGLEQLRLAVILTQPFWYDGRSYTTRQPFALFVTSFARYVKELILFVPLKVSKHEKGDFEISFDSNVKIISCPFYNNTRDLYLHVHKILPEFIKLFLKDISRWDICWIIDTTFVSFISYGISRCKSKKKFLYLRANVRDSYVDQFHSGFGKLVGHVLGMIEEILCRIMSRDTLTFAIGKELFTKYQKKSGLAHLFYANLISDKVILPQERTLGAGNEKIKLLVVGRLTPQKGLEYLVGAIEELVNKKGYNLICDVVGKGGEETGLKDLITQKNLHEYFRFLGHIPWGEGLFNVYQRSDLFILPSLTEGFPKTIFEAMAFGVPVIATDVGGINGIIKHKYNGILVKARSTSGLTAAIHEICSQESMYSKIAENGYKTVRQFTVEVQQHKMLNIIMTHFNIPKKQLSKYEK